ncbi:Gfo/Idh/MocA family oxidoreductase, partial [Rhizobium sp. SEMIA 4085]|uniref:Gfo/Idh/MocA family protein n=1 Tax=Rhizobium sp. SEMIA 4085 TaxID=2137761 RepID=UPI001FEF6C02
MIRKEDRRLRVGVLGCGPIAQFAHLESCAKARNADLYAICDAAPDLLARMGATYEPQKMYADYDAMLADPELEAVIIATSDAYHVPMSIRALDAGKHVLCEKPTGVTIEAGQALADAVKRSGKVLQVGHMKRFDPALEAARDFVRDDIGEIFALKAWYCDSTHRYTNTDAVQPLPITSKFARKPAGNPKADLRQYFMLAHGSHLVDTARFLCGGVAAGRAPPPPRHPPTHMGGVRPPPRHNRRTRRRRTAPKTVRLSACIWTTGPPPPLPASSLGRHTR